MAAGAVGCVSDSVSAPPPARRAAFEPSACAISATRSETWWGSRRRPVAPLVPSPLATGGAVS